MDELKRSVDSDLSKIDLEVNNIYKNVAFEMKMEERQDSCNSSSEISEKEGFYNSLCHRLSVATKNNEFLSLYDEFKKLGDFKDSTEKCKRCLDKMSFSNASELSFLGEEYSKLPLPKANDIGRQCEEVAAEWKEFGEKQNLFKSKYTTRPYLLKLWDRFSVLIIIIGLVTLLNGFLVYFGAVALEYIFRLIFVKIKKSKSEFRKEKDDLNYKKQLLDLHISQLRKR